MERRTMPAWWNEIKTHAVALISLVVALSSLGYNTWRNERTEFNRNVRVAGFEVLKTLGDLQLIVEYAHFRKDRQRGDPTAGWGQVLFIRDLSQLIPDPVPQDAERLLTAWRENWETLETDRKSVERISDEIFLTRQDLLKVLSGLR